MNRLDKIIANCDKEIEMLDEIIESQNRKIRLLNSMIGISDRLSSTQTSKLIKTDYVSAPLERQKILLDLAQQNKL